MDRGGRVDLFVHSMVTTVAKRLGRQVCQEMTLYFHLFCCAHYVILDTVRPS